MNTPSKTALYLDDLRLPTTTIDGYQSWTVVRNYEQFVRHIKDNGIPDLISFDHDLADEHMADYFNNQAHGVNTIDYKRFKEKTGVDCLNWLIELVMDNPEEVKPFTVWVHSHNPLGAANILHKASNFMKHMNWQQNAFYAQPPFIIDTTIENKL